MIASFARVLLVAGALTALTGAPALAQDATDDVPASSPVFSTIYKFQGGARARWPRGGVAVAADGTIYGTTLYGGDCETCGVIYKLAPPAKGKTAWAYTILHKFVLAKNGIAPTGPLTLFNGSLYGAASAGGNPSCGCGVVFKITPSGSYTVLHTFSPSKIGSTPISGLLIDSGGTIYGNTDSGGKHGAGIIYKLSTAGGGFTVLHDFAGDFNGGPQGEMIFGEDGAIYGTQFGGGKYNQGVIFRITKAGAYTVLYDFKGVNQPGNSTDGADPEGRLTLGSDGTIYGTTTFGGTPSGYGTAWSIKKAGSKWDYKQLYIFAGNGHPLDANLPHSGLVAGPAGSLYGTGAGGGKFQEGAIYQLTPPATAGQKWGYKTLHSFNGRDPHGDTPYPDIVVHKGTIYGGTLSGGYITNSGDCINGCGTIFSYQP